LQIFAANGDPTARGTRRVASCNIEATTNTLTIKHDFFTNTATLDTDNAGNEEIDAHRGLGRLGPYGKIRTDISAKTPSAFLPSIIKER
jgi:hypothetical protein